MNEIIEKKCSVINIAKDNYHNFLNDYYSKCLQIYEKSQGTFSMSDSLEENEIVLHKMILESDLCKKYMNKEHYSFEELKSHLSEYEIESNDLLTRYLIENYDATVKLSKLEDIYIEIMERTLSDIISPELMSKYNVIVIDDEKHLELKDSEQLSQDKLSVLRKLENLYTNEYVIDQKNYGEVINMLNEVFNYYKNGHKRINIEQFNQKYDQGMTR